MTALCEHMSFLRLVAIAGQAVRSFADQRLKSHDLTIEQLQLLKEMNVDCGMTQRALCVSSGKSPANVTRIIDRLVKKRLARRTKNPRDRRSTLLTLTREGQSLRDEVIRELQLLEDDLLLGIDQPSRLVLFDTLQAVLRNIQAKV